MNAKQRRVYFRVRKERVSSKDAPLKHWAIGVPSPALIARIKKRWAERNRNMEFRGWDMFGNEIGIIRVDNPSK